MVIWGNGNVGFFWQVTMQAIDQTKWIAIDPCWSILTFSLWVNSEEFLNKLILYSGCLCIFPGRLSCYIIVRALQSVSWWKLTFEILCIHDMFKYVLPTACVSAFAFLTFQCIVLHIKCKGCSRKDNSGIIRNMCQSENRTLTESVSFINNGPVGYPCAISIF